MIPVGARQVVPQVWALVSDADSGLPEALRPVLAEAAREIAELEARVHELERSLEAMARESELVVRLRTIPGFGLLTATALVAFVGNVQRFPSGRHFASYLGLTPRESSSGLRRRLGAISKRGDPYLRMLPIHGARSMLLHAKKPSAEPDRLRAWAAVARKRRSARLPQARWRGRRYRRWFCLGMGGAMRKALIFGLLSIGLTAAVLVGGSNRAECAGDDCPPYNSECSPYGLGNDCKSKSPFVKCGMQCVQVKEGYQTTHRCR
jgi:hypothetical protein